MQAPEIDQKREGHGPLSTKQSPPLANIKGLLFSNVVDVCNTPF